jgi:hypothetical protein
MITLKIIRFGIIVFVFGAAVVANGQPCGGKNHREHNRKPYKFKTSSWVRSGDNGHYYHTCVENIGDDRDLWFDWFIPGPTTYVPPGESVTSSRYFIDRRSNDFNGCIQYGNHRETMKEYFIGHEKDREAVEKEKSTGCNVSRHQYVMAAESKEFNDITYPTTLFVASDANNVKGTLMRLELTVFLRQISADKARSTLTYSAQPVYPNFIGNPNRLRFRTNSPELKKAIFEAGYSQGLLTISEFKGEVSLELPIPSKFAITNARFGLFDEKEVLVGAFFVPIPTHSVSQ